MQGLVAMTDSHEPPPADGLAQSQFLNVISRDEATARFRRHLRLAPLGEERIPLARALGRVLAATVVAPVDVPGFDRSNVDGFAVRSEDTHGATEASPRRMRLTGEVLAPGVAPRTAVRDGLASPVATGGMLPRGADAVVMIEHTDLEASDEIVVNRAVVPGENLSHAGTDIARGETVLRAGQVLGSREIGVLAALGLAEITVWRRPRVAILSTGNEIVAPGNALPAGAVYDSNAAILSAAIEELGCEPVPLGIVRDEEAALTRALEQALSEDAVVLSGGTSKGAGDLSYRVVARLGEPGIVAHGVALKPGKPVCLAVSQGRPVAILPGFPTSAIFTFHEFVAPVLRAYAGLASPQRATVPARLPMRVNSERGRTEYMLVGLIEGPSGWVAYPMGKGSGSVTTFSAADGFFSIDALTEIVDAGTEVAVQRLSERLRPADLVCIGSHCTGLDFLVGELVRDGVTAKTLHVGSMGGVNAARRGECDLAGVHLMDPATGVYNQHLLTPELTLVPGYGRLQGIVHRPDDRRFAHRDVAAAVEHALADPDCTLVNRNAGSGTRVLIDRLLGGRRPPGHGVQTRSHTAVAAAVRSGRADWGVAIDTVARAYGLGFIALQEERYDFLIPTARLTRPAVAAFIARLSDPGCRAALAGLGFHLPSGVLPAERRPV
jgi:putative molybdopterin biosynthesis protein